MSVSQLDATLFKHSDDILIITLISHHPLKYRVFKHKFIFQYKCTLETLCIQFQTITIKQMLQ